jgi:glycosyltransferase involved in cell wall biosynthesis
LIAPVDDAAALAACISHVPDLTWEQRRLLGLRQRDSIAARYDLERVWERYLAVYRSL